MTEPRVHIVGAGVAGLSAALHLSQITRNITLYESSTHAGGRCRSYFDRELNCRLDNGNHLVLSGNVVMRDYLALADAEDTIAMPDNAVFPFMDLRSGERWTIRPNRGRLPWWVLSQSRRIAGTAPADYTGVLRILLARNNETVADLTRDNPLMYERFWHPLTVAALNTPPETASAKLLAGILRQTFGNGGHACIPMVPKLGLSESFVDPVLRKFQTLGVGVQFTRRLRQIDFVQGRAARLDFGDHRVVLGQDDWLILAVPAWVATELVPGITAPNEFSSILNAHYRVDVPHTLPGFTGLIGGIAEWVFSKPGVVSVTVSAADPLLAESTPTVAARIWQDVARLYRLDPNSVPLHRIVREKRATFAATPAQQARRPKTRTRWLNLLLAGDWVQNDLPSTIEGSIRSGLRAAQIVTRWMT